VHTGCPATDTDVCDRLFSCAGACLGGAAAGPVLNEVNTMPGFTEHSQVPKMFAAADLPYPELLDLLVADALAGRCRSPR
jgi:hypothetical protein